MPIAIALARVIQPLNLTALSRRIALAVWCAVIILARIVPAHLNTAADDKRLARDLSKHLPESPHEILFVETAPRFGLRFYLRSEIERIELPDGSARPESEEIASEMHTSEGCRVLLTKPDSADRLEASLNTHKVEFRRLPNVRGYAVFKQISADCPAYGRLSQTHVNSRKTDARGILVATLARGSYRISP